jgi:hypothetical protein
VQVMKTGESLLSINFNLNQITIALVMTNSFVFRISGKGGTCSVRGLRDCDDVRESVRRSHQRALAGRRHRRMLRSETRIPAHRLGQIV